MFPLQVNLKEQGQLRCQDEFIVWCGRRKYLRHVFLFEDLILFSKTKKIEGGYDIYIYKQSFKVRIYFFRVGFFLKFLLHTACIKTVKLNFRFFSIQTAEIGMTENVGDSGLRFEIWFRRRKSQDTFILQASSAEVKAVWTAIIGKILWRQALRNRGVYSCYFDLNVDVVFGPFLPCKTGFVFKDFFFMHFSVAYAGDGVHGDWKQAFHGHQAK